MNSREYMYDLIIRQLKKDGYTSLAEGLSESVGVTVGKESNDLLQIVKSINVGIKVDREEVTTNASGTLRDEKREEKNDQGHFMETESETGDRSIRDEEEEKTPEKRQSSRVLRKPAAAPSKSLENWFWKGDTTSKAKRTVSTVDALDLNESDSHLMVYAAMVHHAADSFMEPEDSDNNPPNLEAQGKEDSPPELHIESIAVESPKDRLPALDAESNTSPSIKDDPPTLQSEVKAPSTGKDSIVKTDEKRAAKKTRRYNPAACDSRELDILTSLDVSPIKAVSDEQEKSTEDTSESKSNSNDKPTKKRKATAVDSDASILKWIEASNVGKPAKRARKEDENDVVVTASKHKIGETFTFNNVTYRQPLLILSRMKIAKMSSSESPMKLKENTPVCASTPKASQINKRRLASPRSKGKELSGTENSDISNVSPSTSPVKEKNDQENVQDRVTDSSSPLKEKRDEGKTSDPVSDEDDDLPLCSLQKVDSSPRKSVGRKSTRAQASPGSSATKVESEVKEMTKKSGGRKASPRPGAKTMKQSKITDKFMNPVVLLKQSEIVTTSSSSSATKKKEKDKAARSIDLHSDGNESEGSWDEKKGSSDEMRQSSSPVPDTGNDVIESFSIDSDSDDESFAPMQAAVDNLLSDLPEETRSPSTSPRAKKLSPRKGSSKRSRSKPSTKHEKKLSDNGNSDSDIDSPVKSSSSFVTNNKSAAEKFAELMGEI